MTTIDRITTAPIPSKHKIALWLAQELAQQKQFRSSYDFAHIIQGESFSIFNKSLNRLHRKFKELSAQAEAAEARANKFAAAKIIFRSKLSRALLKMKRFEFQNLVDTLTDWKGEEEKQLRRLEKAALVSLTAYKGQYESKNYATRLPLYACSGELEANAIKYTTGAKRDTFDFWNVGRDGGGQHEIRFRIHPTITALACKQVTRIGSQSRNGGHIHINCQHNAETGRRVFDAFRAHLVWIRFLANAARRNGRWSAVDNTPADFATACRTKAAAISCNTWNHTGTVEMRLWGTTAKAEEWAFRARLMQSLARMSETVTTCRTPLTRENTLPVFMEFATWAAANDPQTLRETLHRLRKKGRTTADRIGAQQCREMVTAFDASEIRLTGYRRTSATITPNN
jgi:hypothetical protein